MANKYREYFDIDEEYFPQINDSSQALLKELRKKFFSNSIRAITRGFKNMKLLNDQEIVAFAYMIALMSKKFQRQIVDYFIQNEDSLRIKGYKDNDR